MPELPEVEFAARTIRRLALGRRIERVTLDPRARRMLRPAAPPAVVRALTGARVAEVDRRGKQLLLTLDTPAGPLGLLAHLGMTGKWSGGPGAPAPSHARASFDLDDGTALHYQDPRMFGRLRLVPGARFSSVPDIAALGPDPLVDGIDAVRLGSRLARTRRPVKVALLDQRILCGVGNIHAAEACWRARLDPRRRADRLSSSEVAALARGLRATFRHALAQLDGPEIEYLEEGGDNTFHVYERAGLRCHRRGCPGFIRRIVQAQRSTFFCPTCLRRTR
jgi:formamidopyrimidine-DNA glycosylase